MSQRDNEMSESESHRIGLTPKVVPLKLFLDVLPSSSADNLITRVAWMFRGG